MIVLDGKFNTSYFTSSGPAWRETMDRLAVNRWPSLREIRSRCADAARGAGGDAMIGPPKGVQIWLACGVTDLRNGFDGLAAIVQTQLGEHPFSGQLFDFRGRRGDRIKLLWWDGDGLCLFSKRLENGRFIWPQASSGTVHLSPAQLSMLLEGIDWRRPQRTHSPRLSA